MRCAVGFGMPEQGAELRHPERAACRRHGFENCDRLDGGKRFSRRFRVQRPLIELFLKPIAVRQLGVQGGLHGKYQKPKQNVLQYEFIRCDSWTVHLRRWVTRATGRRSDAASVGRQSRRNRAARDPSLPPTRAREPRRLFLGGREFVPPLGRRSRDLHRAATRTSELSQRGRVARNRRCDEMRRRLSRLRISGGEQRLCRTLHRSGADLHRPQRRIHRPHGRQGRRAPDGGCHRNSGRARIGARLHISGIGGIDRAWTGLSAATEGEWRRRRPRHADRQPA